MHLFCLYMHVCKYRNAYVEVRGQAVRVIFPFCKSHFSLSTMGILGVE